MKLFRPLKESRKIRLAFWKIKEELGNHLETINANTDEIQEAFDAIERIEQV